MTQSSCSTSDTPLDLGCLLSGSNLNNREFIRATLEMLASNLICHRPRCLPKALFNLSDSYFVLANSNRAEASQKTKFLSGFLISSRDWCYSYYFLSCLMTLRICHLFFSNFFAMLCQKFVSKHLVYYYKMSIITFYKHFLP